MIPDVKPPRNAVIEWPTLGLLVACHLIWVLATTWLAALWLPVAMMVAALAITLHSSLQHEVLHGHPFRKRRLNESLVFLPLGLVYPYGRFRDTHLAHHRDERLTDPYDDPESNYMDPRVWARLSWPLKALLRINNTLAGRIVLGPAISTFSFLRADIKAMSEGDRDVLGEWILHLAGLVVVLLWVIWSAMPLWAYLLAAYAGMAILKIRTFLEHRAHEMSRGRTVIIERGGVLPFLFLFNSLHVVHHAFPTVAWYRLPALFRAHRATFVARNEGYVYQSYGEIFRRYLLRAKDPVPHPLMPRD